MQVKYTKNDNKLRIEAEIDTLKDLEQYQIQAGTISLIFNHKTKKEAVDVINKVVNDIDYCFVLANKINLFLEIKGFKDLKEKLSDIHRRLWDLTGNKEIPTKTRSLALYVCTCIFGLFI